MLPAGNPIPIVPTLKNNRRKHGRVRANQTMCSLGRVLDVSASGMSVRAPWWRRFRIGKIVKIRLESFGRNVTVKAKVVRVDRAFMCPTDVGLEFHQLSPKAAAEIAAIARGVVTSMCEMDPSGFPLKRAI